MNTALLVLAALAPAVALLIYIYLKDRKEKEPFGLLALLFFCGVAICFPAATIEGWLAQLIDKLFAPFVVTSNGTTGLPAGWFYLYQFVNAFFGVALVEEGLKWAVVLLFTRKNKNFNCLFDGIVYAVVTSLGFAAFENVLYCINNGWTTAIMRAVLSVPGHAFFGVLMGLYYSWWRVYSAADAYETKYQLRTRRRTPDKIKPGKYLFLSLLVPIVAHGLYDFACFTNAWWSTFLLIGVVVFLYVFCLLRVRQMSKTDGDVDDLAKEAFRKRYPGVDPEEGDATEGGIEPPTEPTGTKKPPADGKGAKVLRFPSGDKYVGPLVDGKMSGEGVYYFASGGKYEGSFENGKFNGYGVYISPKGGRYEGNWKDNKRHGKGTYYFASGRVQAGLWEAGEFVGE